jgi:ABC-type transport system involved in cytochrome c biogenesis permease subunit
MRTLLALSLLFTSLLSAADAQPPLSTLREKETLTAWANLPVQEDGRVKPLETIARYRLLRFHGTRSVRMENPETKTKDKFSAMEWLLITWFRPDIAREMPLFRVDFDQAMNELGVDTSKTARFDSYSWASIEPHRQVLMQKAQEYDQIEAKQRTPTQRMIVTLARDFVDYEIMLTHGNFLREPFGPDMKAIPEELAKTLPQPLRLSTGSNAMIDYIKAHPDVDPSSPWLRTLLRLQFVQRANKGASSAFFPPVSGETWTSPDAILVKPLNGETQTPEELAWLKRYEELFSSVGDAADFKAKTLAFAKDLRSADKANAGWSVNLEASYQRADYFYYALCFFILGLICQGIAVGWARLKWSRWLGTGAWISYVVATALFVTGIVIRSVIMARPPITTLYETILFIGATAAISGLIVELIMRKQWGLLLAGICGTASLYLAMRFEAGEGQDTIVQLQAVLITNLWLATHVPCINLGYMACMVAAIISMIYAVGCTFGWFNAASRKDLTVVAYGMLAAGLFFALIGTVLGGVWANDSWGRFWGWDPKENGALMICIMCLITLHARLGGIIREIGFHVCNIVLGCITVFSWFGVNQLGVGLHAYGFTDGVWGWLTLYWASQLGFLLLLGWVKLRGKPTHPATLAQS